MKTWMKFAMWFGLGGGIGFFAGYQAGQRTVKKEETKTYEDGWRDGFSDYERKAEEVGEVLNDYRGGDFDGDHVQVLLNEDDPEMPEEPPRIGDEEYVENDIPQLHPQHLIPVQISEEEYYSNPWSYDQEQLVFYEADKVLFNKETRKAYKEKDDIDQAIGVGMTFQFYRSDGETLDAIFVRNDTMGVIFRIDRIDASYEDEISGAGAPEYEEDDD